MVGGRGEGYVHLNRQRNALGLLSDSTYNPGCRVEENSLAFDFKESQHRITGGDPTKAHVGKGRLNEMEFRQSSPSVIAKLMGLETLPPPRTFHKQKLDTVNCFQKRSPSSGFQEQYAASNEYSVQMSNREHLEFKDVFEVMEASELLEDQNQQLVESLTSLRKSGPHIESMSKKLLDAKSPPSNEFFSVSEELYNDLDSSDIDDNHFLEILQQPNSLFRKHLLDLKCSPPSLPPSHIMILKSVNHTKFEKSKLCTPSCSPERSNQMPQDVTSPFRKTKPSLVCHSLKESSGKLGKRDNSIEHSHIVVLEPNFGKADALGKTDSLSKKPSNFQFLYGRNEEKEQPETPELYVEGREWQNFLEVTGHKTQCSRENTREFANEMRHSANESSRKLHDLGINGWTKHKQPYISFDMRSSATSCRSSKYCDGREDRSSAYSTKTSVSKGPRERLSEQLQSAQKCETGFVGKRSRALSKMLAFSNAENQKTSDLQVMQEILGGVDVSARQCYPSGTSHRFGWKDRHPKSSSRSLSPVSSTVYGQDRCNRCTFAVDGECCMLKDEMNLKFRSFLHKDFSHRGTFPRKSCNCGRRKCQPYIVGGDEKKPFEVDILINRMISGNRGRVACPGEPNFNFSDFPSCDAGTDAGNSKIILTTNERPFEKPSTKAVLTKSAKFSGNDQKDYFSIRYDGTDSASLLGAKVSEQPIPVTVLEPPLGEEKSNSSYFKRMCADLHELQMQLDLLKIDTELYTEEPEAEDFSLPLTGDILEAFRDGDDRDFSYLLDILIELGVHSANQDRLYNYPENCSMTSSTFEKLEKKYSHLVAWSRSERMLLFDMVNSILSEIITLCMCFNPCMKFNRKIAAMWGSEGLVEKVWQMLVRHREELTVGNPENKVLDAKWLDLGDEVNTMGREIEMMLNDDLLGELLLEIS